jgi:hypothetical protein
VSRTCALNILVHFQDDIQKQDLDLRLTAKASAQAGYWMSHFDCRRLGEDRCICISEHCWRQFLIFFRFIISAFDIAAISADGLYSLYCIFTLTDKNSDYIPVPNT